MCILKVDNVCLGWVYSVSSPPRQIIVLFLPILSVCLGFFGGEGVMGGVPVFVLVPLTELSNNICPCKDVKPT